MADDRVRRAARVLRMYVDTAASPHHNAAAMAFLGLMYEDRLGDVPIDPIRPQAAIEELRQRIDEILTEHLALETVLLSIIGRVTGQSASRYSTVSSTTDTPA